MEIQLGDIFKINQTNQTIRVIGLDDFEVHYDNFWDYNENWAFASNLNKKGFFYRMSRDAFIKRTHKIDSQELNQEESDVFKTYLPIRIARIKDISWDSEIFNSKDSLKQLIDLKNYEKIKTNEILLCSVSKNGRFNKSVKFSSNTEYINIIDLLVFAKKVRDKNNLTSSVGIGLYRLGIEKRLPTYYIGEYIDMAGIMREEINP